MKDKTVRHNKDYYFIDVDPRSRKIVGWGIEQQDSVEVHLTNGCHRVFLSKGQYGKLERKLADC